MFWYDRFKFIDPSNSSKLVELSVIIPVFNEEKSIASLFNTLTMTLEGIDYEIVIVDDGSTDNTVDEIKLHKTDNTQIVLLNKNYGQTSALSAGIEKSEGKLIVTMDGDLQNDPADIPIMMTEIKKRDLDVLIGRRVGRKDGLILRKLPSKVANTLIRGLTGVKIHDYGCALKIFKGEIAKNLSLYGEQHRFIPLLIKLQGGRMSEIDVRHHARKFGQSKYGIGRIFKVLSDLIFLIFVQKYGKSPMHFFGTLGSVTFLTGLFINFYLLIIKILGNDIGTRPFLYVGIFLTFVGIQLITTGFIAEFLMRTYYESQNKKPYILLDDIQQDKK